MNPGNDKDGFGPVGIIHEVGDMGLGFDELPEKDQQILKEQQRQEDGPKTK